MAKFSDFLIHNSMIGSEESIEKYKADKNKRMQLEAEESCSEDAFLARIPDPDMTVQIGSVTLKNPICTAAGCYGYGIEYKEMQKLSAIGAIFSNGTTLEPCNGSPQPRVHETIAALLQHNGYENPGVEAVKSDILPQIIAEEATLFVNICGNTVEEFAQCAAALDGCKGVAGVELNLSCINSAKDKSFDSEAASVKEVVAAVKAASKLNVVAKLSANVTDIAAIAKAAEKAGADAISLTNPLRGMVIDLALASPLLANGEGGLCGPAIKPIALRAVWEASSAVKIPVIGCGGIATASDALEFIMAGASAVQIGSANFVFPDRYIDIQRNVIKYMKQQGLTKLPKLVGMAKKAK